jgi:Anthrone oxygenase
MFHLLQIVAVMLAAVALVPALAHALELPGKMRLAKEEYFSAQTIYYPGFTVAGVAEPLALIATAGLLAHTPRGGLGFWLIALALIGLIGMQAVYWLFTHPVNKVWVQPQSLGVAGSGFFSLGSPDADAASDWRNLRDRWEYSHLMRACLSATSFMALVVATS